MPKGVYKRKRGWKMPEAWKAKISLAHKGTSKPWLLKEKASKRSIHLWVERKLGKPKKCEKCGTEDGKFDWANKDHKYKRNLKDWMRLCKLCHWKYDRKHNNKVATRNVTGIKNKYEKIPKLTTKNCVKCILFRKLKKTMLSIEIANKFNVSPSSIYHHLYNHKKDKFKS